MKLLALFCIIVLINSLKFPISNINNEVYCPKRIEIAQVYEVAYLLANERTSMDFSNPYFHQKYLIELNRIMEKTTLNELDKMEMTESLMVEDEENEDIDKNFSYNNNNNNNNNNNQRKKHAMIPALNADDNSVVGFVDIERRDSSSFPFPSPYVSDCVVSKAFRRRGVGSALLAAAEERARSWGDKELYLYVTTENQGAVQFYRQCGFFPVRGEVGPLDEPYVSETINYSGNLNNKDDDENDDEIVIDGEKILPTATWDKLGSLYERILLKKFI